MFLKRCYSNLSEYIPEGKVLIIYGPRQVGKTTLVNHYLEGYQGRYLLINGDDIITREQLSSEKLQTIISIVEGYNLLVIDEAQRIPKIGLALKMLIDHRKDLKIIATGSSSFDLLGQVGEPLTGRKKTIMLYPVWTGELLQRFNHYEIDLKLSDLLIYGLYPEVVTAVSKEDKRQFLNEITNSYLLKDILEMDKVKSAKPVINLLRLLAFQTGNEVSYNELSNSIGIDVKTVARYLDLFEKSHIVIRLSGYSRNMRTEITSKAKYYFYDTGVRNALIANFNDLELRDDIGALWENFIFIERLKKRSYNHIYANEYFWRTWSQQEIDLIEEREGKLFAYEIKWKKGKHKTPTQFIKSYPDSVFEVISRENYQSFII
jgi:uncharacterized protein